MGIYLRPADRAVVCEGGVVWGWGDGVGFGFGEQLGFRADAGCREYAWIWIDAWFGVWIYSRLGVWNCAGEFFAFADDSDYASSAAAAVIDRGFRG